VLIALLVYLLFELFNTYVGIPYNSMGGLATNVDADRRSINVSRNLGGCIGAGIGAISCMPLLKLFGALDNAGNLNDNASRGFLLVAIFVGAIVIIGCLIHYGTTKERVKPIADDNEKLPVKTVFKMLLHSKSWVLNTLYIICYAVTNLLLLTNVAYYATYVLGNTSASTFLSAVYLLACITVCLLAGPIDRALGRKRTMILGLAVPFIGRLWFMLDPTNLAAMYINIVTAAFAMTVAFIMMNTNRNNIVDLIEWKDGRRLDGLVSTADGLASKLATAGATQLIAIALSVAGLDAALEKQPASVGNTINLMLGVVPFIVSIVMLVVVLFFTVEDELKKMREEKAQIANGR
jgi:GPH family glycoside/pentoside/hexuronide:cation symporter